MMRVATYAWVSTDEERQPYSREAQATRLESYIASQDGWELARTFTDQCSGATLNCPALQRARLARREGRASKRALTDPAAEESLTWTPTHSTECCPPICKCRFIRDGPGEITLVWAEVTAVDRQSPEGFLGSPGPGPALNGHSHRIRRSRLMLVASKPRRSRPKPRP